MKLLRRARRKFESDGLQELLAEGRDYLYRDLVLERYFYYRWLERHREVVLSSGELFEVARESGIVLPEKSSTGREFAVKTSFETDRSFDDVQRTKVRTPFLANLGNCGVIQPGGLGVTNDGQLVEDTVIRISVALASVASERGLWWTKSRVLDDASRCLPAETHLESAAVLVPSYTNYYHWLIECIPRLRPIERYREETGTSPAIIVPRSRPGWMDQTLSIAGVRDEVAAQDVDVVGVSQLLVPSRPQPTPGDLCWLRERMTEGVGSGPSDRRIMISRSDATRRRIANEGEVREVLDELGIEVCVLSEMSVEEQVSLFSGAELVVAPHGAGLTNIVFGEDLSVVELFGRKKSTTFYRLASMLGFDYLPVYCDSDGLDIRVDPDRLREAVRDSV